MYLRFLYILTQFGATLPVRRPFSVLPPSLVRSIIYLYLCGRFNFFIFLKLFIMGKQISVLNIRGKVGNVVGYSYLDSKNTKAAGVRIYQGDVKNPQTDAQARQRARMLPLTSFYRLMRDVITRGYQEVGYGQPSRRIFMRDNMKTFEGPWLVKGTVPAIPGPYIIARGSLIPITVSAVSATAATTDLGVGTVTTVATIGELSAALMANNTDIQQGDQLTFIMGALITGTSPAVVYRVQSIVIAPDDATPLPFTATITGGALLFSVGLKPDEVACAAAVIQSRDGGFSHLRSFAQLAVNSSALAAYFGNAAVERSVASYQTLLNTNDWPVEQFAHGTASSPLTLNGLQFVGIVQRGGVAYFIDGNGGENLIKNTDAKDPSYGKYMGDSTWITIADPTGSIVEVSNFTAIYAMYDWLIRNYGYSAATLEGLD